MSKEKKEAWGNLISEKPTLKEIATEVQRLDAAFLIGGDRPSSPGEFENYGIFIDERGEISGEYLKQHPVPFGEYIPFRKYLDWIPPLSLVPRDMVRGIQQQVFTTKKNGHMLIFVSSIMPRTVSIYLCFHISCLYFFFRFSEKEKK